MARAKMVKTPVSNKLPVDTVVIDDEETITSSPVNDDVVHRESVADIAGQIHPVTVEDISKNPSLSVEVKPVKPDIDVNLDRDNIPAVDKKV